ncbi:MAG: type 1 glutamine amidotransferase [Bdellovibrionales bacterium]
MRKVIVFQHVAHEILGTLNPLLKKRGFRVRYINFDRYPESEPSLEKYNGLIVLGGHMGVYEAETYRHIKVELKLIEEALKKEIPILGICLGAQMLAHVLGAEVRKSAEKEIGWCEVELTAHGEKDPLLGHFKKHERVFQIHGDTFDIPKSAEHLAASKVCRSQAFRVGDKVYGLQFHLEVDEAMVHRWLKTPQNIKDLHESQGKYTAENIKLETTKHIARSLELSRQTFQKFIDTFGLGERPELLGSGHGKPHRAGD